MSATKFFGFDGKHFDYIENFLDNNQISFPSDKIFGLKTWMCIYNYLIKSMCYQVKNSCLKQKILINNISLTDR